MPPAKITGPQMAGLSDALRGIYTYTTLGQMLKFRLDRTLEDYSPHAALPTVLFNLLDCANRQGWMPHLITAAREDAPSDAKLRMVAESLELAAAPVVEGQRADETRLEKIVKKGNKFLNPTAWREQLGKLEPRVCRVDLDAQPAGTAFLVGANVALTNYHVVEPVIQGHYEPSDVELRFDYRTAADGLTVSAGRTQKLKADWLIEKSPYSPLDEKVDPEGEPGDDSLDFALILIDGTPGAEPIGPKPPPGADPRGWIDVPKQDVKIAKGLPVLILQHPEGEPLKMSMDNALDRNAGGTRQKYLTNTLPGSSGSPCFDIDFNLSLLHHAGDPKYEKFGKFNQGIPVAKIRKKLPDVLGRDTAV